MHNEAKPRDIDIVCVSHLRWDFVFQRPQHLLTRARQGGRVLYIEEPVWSDGPARMDVRTSAEGVQIAVPHLPPGQPAFSVKSALRQMLAKLIEESGFERYVLWYYTPLALAFTDLLTPAATVYDCMDELSAFRGASPELCARERELLARADVVFTGGRSLYESKRQLRQDVHLFPSSVDVAHFARAREPLPEPPDQAPLRRPRLGFFGVIDERFDIELLRGAAAARPEWEWVMVGPVVKIDPASLPRAANIHWLGSKTYRELPAYLSSWDVALLLFARNESTRFISPTKTPEYLAAGKPVVSTSIRDVVQPYGKRGLVEIADDVEGFVTAAGRCLAGAGARWRADVDAFLAELSWDRTWKQMRTLVERAVEESAMSATRPAARTKVGARAGAAD